jgi:hypothetical protein
VDATQDQRSTSPDKKTTRVPPGTLHRSAHVDTPSAAGHGLAAPALAANSTVTATNRNIVPRRLSRRPRCSPSSPAHSNAASGHSPSLARTVFEPRNARRRPCHPLQKRRPCHEKTRTKHARRPAKRGTPKKKEPPSKPQAKKWPTAQSDTSERERTPSSRTATPNTPLTQQQQQQPPGAK